MRESLYSQVHFPRSTPAFASVPKETRDSIRILPPTRETLNWSEGQVEALREAEIHNPSFSAPPPPTIRIAAWNLQQCHFPAASAEVLSRAGIDVALLTEMDIGMNRSGQHHTLALVSELLAQSTGIPRGYGAGIEFYELKMSDNTMQPTGREDENRSGFHANGWITRFKARRPALIRLQPEADWFVNPRRGMRRIGSRLCLAAIFELGQFELVCASAHLESDTDAAGRRRQMRYLLEGLQDYAGKRPIVLGGDFNTGAHHADFDYKTESLFREAERCGFAWQEANTREPTSRPSRIPNRLQQSKARFDWFFVKGIQPQEPCVIPAVDKDGMPLSDHDAIAINLPVPQEQ